MKKLFSLCVIILLIICSCSTKIYAENENTCMLLISKSSEGVYPGNVVEVKVTASDINTEIGMTAFMAQLHYDETIFEKVDNIPGAIYDPESKMIMVGPFEATKSDKELFKIPLIPKIGVNDGSYPITFSNIQVVMENNADGILVNFGEATIEVNVVDKQNNVPSPTVSPTQQPTYTPTNVPTNPPTQIVTNTPLTIVTNPPTQNTGNNGNGNGGNNGNNGNNNNNNNNNGSTQKLPQTGIVEGVEIAIGSASLLSVVMYIRYKKYKVI